MSTTEQETRLRTDDNGDTELESVNRLRKSAEVVWSYTPFGEKDAINLTPSRARSYLVTPTKTGKQPSDKELTTFLQICKIRRLNPWVRDCFLLGYDTRDGAKFDVIIAYQALAKRAEAHEQYDGMSCGVIVVRDGEMKELEGAFVLTSDVLVGAWAAVFRKDRTHSTIVKINRSAYDKQRSVWATDPAGMLTKCAKAGAMREAFPNDLGGMYTEDEPNMGEIEEHPQDKFRMDLEDLESELKRCKTETQVIVYMRQVEDIEDAVDRRKAFSMCSAALEAIRGPHIQDSGSGKIVSASERDDLVADDGEIIEIGNIDESVAGLDIKVLSAELQKCETLGDCEACSGVFTDQSTTDDERDFINHATNERIAEIKSQRGENSNTGDKK